MSYGRTGREWWTAAPTSRMMSEWRMWMSSGTNTQTLSNDMCLAGSNKDNSQTTLRIPLHSTLTHKGSFAFIMINTETKLRSADLHVCFQETGCRAGKTECSTCWKPYLPSRWFNLQRFLVDSGASVSIFPHHGPPPKFPKLRLQTADGSHVSCNGERLIPVRFGSTSYEWSFQLAPVTVPILGADFLLHFRLLVDMAGQRVLDALGFSAAPPRHGIFHHIKPTLDLQFLPRLVVWILASWQRVSQDGGCWDYPPLRFPMGQSSTYGS